MSDYRVTRPSDPTVSMGRGIEGGARALLIVREAAGEECPGLDHDDPCLEPIDPEDAAVLDVASGEIVICGSCAARAVAEVAQ